MGGRCRQIKPHLSLASRGIRAISIFVRASFSDFGVFLFIIHSSLGPRRRRCSQSRSPLLRCFLALAPWDLAFGPSLLLADADSQSRSLY
ncbi:hypothetical protein KSP40_PGU002902 [Platanthera guangdongensis]|uniref:Uncharacterized protein n=1 Tax=Platanthera guangdongensis TaxID=2320717 RepID=A0ABR2LF03_9ASPA